MAANEQERMLFKILLVGDGGSGKSSLMQRYTQDTFVEAYIPTIGVDFQTKAIDIESNAVKFQIWDCSGQERFRTITTAYYRGAHGIMLLFDINDMESFNHIRSSWLSECQAHSDHAALILVGTKIDLGNRAVDFATAKEFATANRMEYIEVSSRNDTNIKTAFELLLAGMKPGLLQVKGDYAPPRSAGPAARKQCVECDMEAVAQCNKCDAYFCAICWDKVHQFKVNSSHERKSLL
ncbi:GTP-binding protein yptV1 [Pelomyxa schiedti]|nr:GTP-binding protein yptV1 [Pelomyxa schiedti]